jgi:Mor family transcriptional regulator
MKSTSRKADFIMSIDFYNALTDIAQSHLVANSMNADAAVNIAKDIVNDVAERFGGTAVYLKNNTQQRVAEKHHLIVSEFTGKNHAELIKKYQISSAWLAKILKRNEAHDETTIK